MRKSPGFLFNRFLCLLQQPTVSHYQLGHDASVVEYPLQDGSARNIQNSLHFAVRYCSSFLFRGWWSSHSPIEPREQNRVPTVKHLVP